MIQKNHKQLIVKALAGAAAVGGLASGITIAQTGPSPAGSPSPTSSSSPTSSPSPSSSQSAASSPSIDDVAAVNYLHHVNQLELQESAEALGRLQDPSAIQLAQTLQTDHQQNENQVLQLASTKSLPVFIFQPATFEMAADQALRNLSSPAYDQAFKDHERKDHDDVLRQLQSFQSNVTDPDLKALIAQTIPVVQKHEQMAGGTQGSASGTQPGSCNAQGSPGTQPSPSATPSPGSSSQPASGGQPAGGSGTQSS